MFAVGQPGHQASERSTTGGRTGCLKATYSPDCKCHPAGIEGHVEAVLRPRDTPCDLVRLFEEDGITLADNVSVQSGCRAGQRRVVELVQGSGLIPVDASATSESEAVLLGQIQFVLKAT